MILKNNNIIFSTLLLTGLLTGCAPRPREWKYEHCLTKDPCFNSGRLTLKPENAVGRLQIEIDRTPSGLRMYINLLLLQAAPNPDNPSQSTAEIIFQSGEKKIIYPYLLQGGQRLLVPAEMANEIISRLLDHESLTIKLGRNQTEIIPVGFDKTFNHLMIIKMGKEFIEESDKVSSNFFNYKK